MTAPGRRAIAAAALVAAGLAAAVGAAPEPLRVALTGKYPPFSFTAADGELAGFDVDVARAIGHRLGRPVEIVPTEWDGILLGLLLGEYDAIVGSMAVTPEREEKVAFSRPYYLSGPQVFVHERDRDAVGGLDDLAGERVGVGLGETYEQFLRAERPEVEAVAYKSTADIFQDLRIGRIRAFFTDRLVGLSQIESAGLPFVAVGDPVYRERIAIPVRTDRPELLASIDGALAAMRSDGELAGLRARWFGEQAEARPAGRAMPGAVIARNLARGFGVTLFVAVASTGIGFLAAVPIGLGLHRGPAPLRVPLRTAVDFVRATPVLIQLFFVYYGAPQLGLTLRPLTAAVATLSLAAAAYMAEVVRSGLLAVRPGQELAARALGLSRWQSFRFVVWPQAFRVALPALVNSAVALMKDTALVSVISVAEVVREAQSIISVTFEPLEWYFAVAALFFAVTFPLMKLAERLERRLDRRGSAA